MEQIIDILNSINGKEHYKERYIKFISRRYSRQLVSGELHHIIPKCLRPEFSDLLEHEFNALLLTPREHYIAHWMLAKAFGRKLLYAFNMMSVISPTHDRKYKINSKAYEYLKSEMKINNPGTLEEVKQSIRSKALERWANVEFRLKMREINSNQEVRDKKSRSCTNSWTKERREKQSKRFKEKWDNIEYRERMSSNSSNMWEDQIIKENIIKSIKQRWEDPDYRNKMSEIVKQRWTQEKRMIQSIKMTGVNNHFYGKTHSDEVKKRLSECRKGKSLTKETKEKISKANTNKTRSTESRERYSKARSGTTHSQESKNVISEKAKQRYQDIDYLKKMSEAQKNRKKGLCNHCGIEMDICNLKKYHLDKCKLKDKVKTVEF